MRKSAFRRSSLQRQIADRLRHILLRNMRRKRNKWSSLTETWPAVCTVWFNPVYFYCTAGIHLLKRLHISEEAKSIHWEVSVKECLKGTHACFFKCILNRNFEHTAEALDEAVWHSFCPSLYFSPSFASVTPICTVKCFLPWSWRLNMGRSELRPMGDCADVTWLDEVSSGE